MLHSSTIQDFRCIAAAELDFSPDVNLILGPNASGKTSLLEALFFMGRSRSFRTARIQPLIREGCSELLVTARVEQAGRPVTLGIRRSRQAVEMRLAGEPVRSLAELAQALPVQVLDPSVHGLLDDGPRIRRRFLDWGVFHVEHGFQTAWQRYGRALRQRNVLLRSYSDARNLEPWEQELVETGAEMDRCRKSYLQKIAPILEASASKLLDSDDKVSIEYLQGWPEGSSLQQALQQGRARDRVTGATQSGPHRADISIRMGANRAQDRVSRGQQKVLAGALVLTQLAEYHRHTGRQAVLLADDLPAELDAAHLARFLELAQAGGNQLFVTAIRPETLPESLTAQARVFHVEHGVVTPA